MGIIMSALAAAGDEGVKSINQNIAKQNQMDMDKARSDLETQKAKAVIDYQKNAQLDADNQRRQAMSDRIAAQRPAIIDQAMSDQYAPSDAAVAAANAGQTDAPLTPEQLAVIGQSKAIDKTQFANDPHTYIQAAIASGDIDPKEVAQIAMQTDALKRQEAAQEAQFDHADNAQERSQNFAVQQQGRSEAFQAGESAKSRALTEKMRMTDPMSIETNARAIASGQMPAMTGNALRSPGAAATMARVMEINPSYSAKDYGTGAKAEKDFATGKLGSSVRSFNVALSHLNTLGNMADALKNGDVQAFNRLGNFVATQTGAPAPTDFNAVKHIVGDEIVKAVTGGGGALGDREAAAKSIDAANSPAQLRGVINSYKELMVGQIHGLADQYKATTGKDDFKTKYLSDDARAILDARNPTPGASPAMPPDIANLLNKYGNK